LNWAQKYEQSLFRGKNVVLFYPDEALSENIYDPFLCSFAVK
jgi:hypothetical protein